MGPLCLIFVTPATPTRCRDPTEFNTFNRSYVLIHKIHGDDDDVVLFDYDDNDEDDEQQQHLILKLLVGLFVHQATALDFFLGKPSFKKKSILRKSFIKQ